MSSSGNGDPKYLGTCMYLCNSWLAWHVCSKVDDAIVNRPS